MYKVGDRVRFIGASDKGWNGMPREMVGYVGVVKRAEGYSFHVVFDKDYKGYRDWSLRLGQMELERPLSPFEVKVRDYIRRELHDV